MIESKTKSKITHEEREYFLSKRNSEFIKEAIGRGIMIGFVYLLLLIPTLFSEGLDFLIKTEHLVMFCVFFIIYIFHLTYVVIRLFFENLDILRGDKIVLVGKPTRLYMVESDMESLGGYYIEFDKTTFEITARQYDKLQNATRVEVHYTPKKKRVLKIAAVEN